jgi:hypothetical protein
MVKNFHFVQPPPPPQVPNFIEILSVFLSDKWIDMSVCLHLLKDRNGNPVVPLQNVTQVITLAGLGEGRTLPDIFLGKRTRKRRYAQLI